MAADPDPDDTSPYREQIARFRTLFAQSHSFAAVVVGPDHRFFLVNPAFERLVGNRPVLGLPLSQAFPEMSRQELPVLLDRVLATGEAQVRRDAELSFQQSDGSTDSRRVDVVCQAIADENGEMTAIFLEGTDVTERFRASEALRDVERRNRQVLDSAVDYAIIATDLDGRVTGWNRGAELVLGWSEEEMLGETIERIFKPADRDEHRLESEFEQARKIGRGTGEGWRLRKSGERFWAHGEMTPLLDDTGVATGFVKVLRDRTAEHEATEALRQSEDRLRRAQEAGGVGVFSVDVLDGSLEPSPQFCRIFGIPQCDRIATSEVEALVLPEDRSKASNEMGRQTGDLQLATEYRIRRADDGEVRTIARRGEFERDPNGRTIRMLGVVQDVTEQRLAQAAIAESEARFRAFAEAVPNQVWSATLDGRLDWANQRTFDFDGHDLARLTASGWETQVHPEDRSRAVEAWKHAVATGNPYVTEFRLRRADGVYRWHISRAVALLDDGGLVERWIGTNTDIHEERSAREALAELNVELERRVEERTRERDRAWRSSQDLQAVLDTRGTFRAVNDAWEIVLGWPRGEVVGREYSDFVHPDDLAAAADALETARHEPLTPQENRFAHRDGTWRWISWVAAPEGDAIYASGRHLTAEKEAAIALEAAQEQLRQAQKMEAVGQLTGGVAHDFNNLLTVIRGSVDLLKRDDLSPERRAKYLDAIGSTADRATKLTGQLLAFARRQTLKPEVFDAAESVGEVAEMIRTLTGSRINLTVAVPTERCHILADRAQFDTAIVNMGINARDAMGGEGQLTIATGPVSGIPALRGHAAVAGDFVAVTVTDNGTGIAREDVDRIFEPFFTTKPVGQGTGLGLSQVIGFAKQSGGDIRVESELGEGTTFTLYLPRSGQEQVSDKPNVNENVAGGAGISVLVVEDNSQVGEFATNALRELGYECTLATSATEALKILALEPDRFQVVFSDVEMPGMSGLELGEEIRSQGLLVAIVLTSGYSHVLAQNGAHGFELLHKPYSIEQLSRVLQSASQWARSDKSSTKPD